MKVLAILQARMTSSRLPGKVMLGINGYPMIYWQILRILKCSEIDKLVVATSIDSSDDVLVDFLNKKNIPVHRGSLTDVHSRFLEVVQNHEDYETVVRLTADCPLVMPRLLTEMIHEFSLGQFDYYTNCITPTYPDGLDIEIFSREMFLRMSHAELSEFEREHVTFKFRSPTDEIRIGHKIQFQDLSALRWTVDYAEDFDFVKRIFEHFKGSEAKFSAKDVLDALLDHPELNTQLPGTLRNIALQGRELETE